MYERIKQLADEAVALQNKLQMEAALRNISEVCTQLMDSEALRSTPTGFRPMTAEQFEAAETAQHQAARGQTVEVPAGERLEAGEPVVIVKGAAKKAKKEAK